MIKVKNIDHVAVAVGDLDAAAAHLGAMFGLHTTTRERVAGQETDVLFLHPDPAKNDAAVELICPTGQGDNKGLRRFLDQRGPGLHHVCFEVEDLAAALADLKAQGVALIDEQPRPGARGHQVAFIHPRATGGVLFELCQKGDSR